LHTFSVSIGKKKEGKIEVGVEVGEGVPKNPHKYGHIGVGLFLTPSPSSPRYVTVTFTKNDLQC